jgi:uncharacterized protein
MVPIFPGNNFLVGISIDGPKKLHNAYRQDKKGNPSFDKVMQAIRLMQKHGVEFNILATVNRLNADHPLEVYKFFKEELSAQFIQFIPIVELESEDSNGNINVSNESVLPEQYGNFLIAIFDEWIKSDVGKVYIQIFDAAMASSLIEEFRSKRKTEIEKQNESFENILTKLEKLDKIEKELEEIKKVIK